MTPLPEHSSRVLNVTLGTRHVKKCIAHGEYCGKVIYRDIDAPLRTGIAFDKLANEEHYSEPCPLKPFPVGCVSQFGLDYMHLVCLCVVRRLLLYWKEPVGPLCVRLGSKAVSQLSQKLTFFANLLAGHVLLLK